MDALFENKNILGYILVVAVLGLLILRLQASRRQDAALRERRRPALRRLESGEPVAEEPSNSAEEGTPETFDKARLQFYAILAAVIALIVGYLVHRTR